MTIDMMGQHLFIGSVFMIICATYLWYKWYKEDQKVQARAAESRIQHWELIQRYHEVMMNKEKHKK